MEFIVITGPTFFDAESKIAKALESFDGIELRLDMFRSYTKAELEEIVARCQEKGKKVIFTLRSQKGGGAFSKSYAQLEEKIFEISLLSPTYLDVESSLSADLFQNLSHAKVIASFHDFEKTPIRLEEILTLMQKKNAYGYKLCTTALDESDAFRMLSLVHKKSKEGMNLIGLCMGEKGKVTREDGLKVGNYLNYRILSSRDKVAGGLIFA
ncbi:type I 3-dehydroquinate dehydratase [bacterium]|nr:type I 3-dehydroquinate dehydratase [bacterium]